MGNAGENDYLASYSEFTLILTLIKIDRSRREHGHNIDGLQTTPLLCDQMHLPLSA